MFNNNVYILIPFFNFLNSEKRVENIIKSVQLLPKNCGLEILVIEGLLPNQTSKIEKELDKLNIFKYVSYKIPSMFWAKENLLNKGVEHLPNDWNYVAWLDCDIIFAAHGEVLKNEIVEQLEKYDTIQLFKYVFRILDKFKLTFNINASMGYLSHLTKEERPHPGYGWAINRKIYEKVGGFYDKCIIGGYDLLLKDGLLGSPDRCRKDYSEDYKNEYYDYMDKLKGITFGYLPATITHLAHGDTESRQYSRRFNILADNKYSPKKDIVKNDDGIICFANKNTQLESDIAKFFSQRID